MARHSLSSIYGGFDAWCSMVFWGVLSPIGSQFCSQFLRHVLWREFHYSIVDGSNLVSQFTAISIAATGGGLPEFPLQKAKLICVELYLAA
jgi:hypothetical protein